MEDPNKLEPISGDSTAETTAPNAVVDPYLQGSDSDFGVFRTSTSDSTSSPRVTEDQGAHRNPPDSEPAAEELIPISGNSTSVVDPNATRGPCLRGSTSTPHSLSPTADEKNIVAEDDIFGGVIKRVLENLQRHSSLFIHGTYHIVPDDEEGTEDDRGVAGSFRVTKDFREIGDGIYEAVCPFKKSKWDGWSLQLCHLDCGDWIQYTRSQAILDNKKLLGRVMGHKGV